MQEDTALSSPDDRSVASQQIIDDHEYADILEQIQAVRQHVRGLSGPTELDPWCFFAPFDRVKLKPEYVPDFICIPFDGVYFGPGGHTGFAQGPLTLTTRRVSLPRQPGEEARVIVPPPIQLNSYPKEAFSLLLAQQGLEGLVCERVFQWVPSTGGVLPGGRPLASPSVCRTEPGCGLALGVLLLAPGGPPLVSHPRAGAGCRCHGLSGAEAEAAQPGP
jgi:hypothetical protein